MARLKCVFVVLPAMDIRCTLFFIVLLAALIDGARYLRGRPRPYRRPCLIQGSAQQRLLEEQRRRLEALQNLLGARLSEPPRATSQPLSVLIFQEVRLSGAVVAWDCYRSATPVERI